MKNEPPLFAVFWEQVWRPYARHTDGRGLAREAFAKHVKNGAEPQDIIDGAKCFFRTMKDRDREFIPLSATWLNRESYIDLAIQERQHQQRMAEAQTRQALRVEQIKEQATVPSSTQIDPARRAQMVAEARAVFATAKMQRIEE